MHLRPSHHDAIFPALHNPYIIVLVGLLLRGTLAAVSLCIRHGAGDPQIVLLEVAAVGGNPRRIPGAKFAVHPFRCHAARLQGVDSHAVQLGAPARTPGEEKNLSSL